MTTRRRLWIARAAVAAVSLILSLAAAEGIARLVAPSTWVVLDGAGETPPYQPADGVLGYEPVPGVAPFNGLGLRDHKYDLEKRPGARRVLVLGDSVAYGPGLDLDETFDNQLEQRLATAPGGPVEVLNLAVPGYNSEQEAAILRSRGLDLDPDLVLVAWAVNDFGRSRVWVRDGEQMVEAVSDGPSVRLVGGALPGAQIWLLRRSTLARLGASAWARPGRGGAALDMDVAANSLALLDIAAACAEQGRGVLYALFPALGGTDEDAAALCTAIELLQANGLPYLDLTPTLQGAPVQQLRRYPADPVHLSPLACELAAVAVQDVLLAQGFDPVGLDGPRELVVGRVVRDEGSKAAAGGRPPDDSRDGEERDTPDLGEGGDPLTGAERFGVPPGASGTGVEILVERFGVARCGVDLCLGVRLSEAPQGRLHVMVSFKPEGPTGEAGRITVPTDGNGQVDVGHGRPLDAAVSARWEGPELRVRVPLADLHPVHGGASFVVSSPKLESVAGPALRYPESSPLGFRVDPR